MNNEENAFASNIDFEKAGENVPERPDAVAGFPNFGHIKLTGVLNCRDLGGMPTEDGRSIAKRRLLRSGDLHHASEADIKQLENMHDLKRVVDFRTEVEIENAPDPLELLGNVEYVHLAAVPQNEIMSFMHANVAVEAHVLHEFIHSPFEMIDGLYSKALLGEMGMMAYSDFLEVLLKADSDATLWHCTQGKDRTGIAAIIVETILGVSKEDIFNDYLATNLYVQGWMDRIVKMLSKGNVAKKLDDDLKAYAYANRCYFDTVYKIADSMFGSMDGYITKALHFDDDKKEALRAMYLV